MLINGAKMSELKGTILVVDDEPEIREIIELYATDLGLNVIEAKDGQEAYETVKAQHIDVIVSDLQMPRMSGISFLEAIRDDGYATPFIFVTAYPSRDSTVHALRLGAFDYIEKPFEKNNLQTLIAEALRVSLEQQELLKISKQGNPSNDAEIAIVKMRTLRSQDQDKNKSAPVSNKKLLELFVEEAEPQLLFCKASIEALSDIDKRSSELGYILRVMKTIHTAAQAINQPVLAETLRSAERCYTYLRIKPRSVTDKVLKVLKQTHIEITKMVNQLTLEDHNIEAPEDVIRLLNQIADNISSNTPMKEIDKAS
jgi:CheY-like chemotaxis protein